MLILKGLVGIHRTVQLQLLQLKLVEEPSSASSDWGIGLNYYDVEWFALEMNRDHSVVFEIACKYCISDFFVVYDGYSISPKGFLSPVVDIMVI